MSNGQQLKINTKLTLFSGKGGVGKTTCASAVAVKLAQQGYRTLLFSTDPAHSLLDIFGDDSGNVAIKGSFAENLDVLEIDAGKVLEEIKEKYWGNIVEVLFTCTYLDKQDIENVMQLSIPGLDEIIGLKKIFDFIEQETNYDRYIWDSAPTGHTLRLLELPDILDDWVKVFASMQIRYRYVVSRLGNTKILKSDEDFLFIMKRIINRLKKYLKNTDICGFIAVTEPEWMAVRETEKMCGKINAIGMNVKNLIINGIVPENSECCFCKQRRAEQDKCIEYIGRRLYNLNAIKIELLPEPVKNLESLMKISQML